MVLMGVGELVGLPFSQVGTETFLHRRSTRLIKTLIIGKSTAEH